MGVLYLEALLDRGRVHRSWARAKPCPFKEGW